MAIPGRLNWSRYGADGGVANSVVGNGGATTVALAALNAGWCARFAAPDTRDVASVWVAWNTVAAAGTVQLRIETIDATTGKPTGTLYDANAVKSFTPATTWQQVTFNTLPTTGLTAGAEYAIVLLTTVGGTTHTLRSHVSNVASAARLPLVVLTAADGTTRSNFAEVAASLPICTVVFEDSLEETPGGMSQFSTRTLYNVFGTAAVGPKFVVPSGLTLSVVGVDVAAVLRTGTPAGDLRCRIFTSSDVAVAGTTVTVDKDSLLNANTRRLFVPFAAPVSLAAGTYRAVFDSASSANGSNCWTLSSMVARASAMVPAEFNMANIADVTAATPLTWTDTAAEQFAGALVLDDVTGGGGGGLLLNSGMTGGLRG